MTRRTRNFVIASLTIVSVGIGTGLFAYYTRATALSAAVEPDEIRFVPREATLVAFANVQEVRTSELRQKMRDGALLRDNGPRALQSEAGIDFETDVDRVLLGVVPSPGAPAAAQTSLMVARGRFDFVKIERAMRDRGARVADHNGVRLLTWTGSASDPAGAPHAGQAASPAPLTLAFAEPGLVVFGDSAVVRRGLDAGKAGTGAQNNPDLITRLQALDRGSVWAVGRFDALPNRSPFGQGVVGQLPTISWFAASGHIDAGLKAQLSAETRDETSANGLRDVVRGLVALGRMQAGSQPELQSLLQSVQLGGVGQTVTLSLDLSPQTLELFSNGRGLQPMVPRAPNRARP